MAFFRPHIHQTISNRYSLKAPPIRFHFVEQFDPLSLYTAFCTSFFLFSDIGILYNSIAFLDSLRRLYGRPSFRSIVFEMHIELFVVCIDLFASILLS